MANKIRQKNGHWINTDVFREEAIKFKSQGFYTEESKGSPGYMAYWKEQLRRCVEGYEVEGQKITGHHYAYLNFSQIKSVEKLGGKVAKKVTNFPDFWDGDYEYFWSLEIARNGIATNETLAPATISERSKWMSLEEEMQVLRYELDNYATDTKYLDLKKQKDTISQKILDRLCLKVRPHLDWLEGGHHMIVGKSRRKGYSYKNGAISTNIYNTRRSALVVLAAYESKFLYPRGTMTMTSGYMDFLNKSTAWAKGREYLDRVDHKKASFKKEVNGATIEAGYQSEVMCITFKDNPDAARGKDAYFIMFEEAGKFPNLKASIGATEAAMEAGDYFTGQYVIFGTGGDMEKGTIDFADMFFNPMENNIMPFENIWDENSLGTYCGFFHPVHWNMEGFYDSMGNSNIEGAIRAEQFKRERIKSNAKTKGKIDQRVQEYPFGPSEAFLMVSTNDFPTVELRSRLLKVEREKIHTIRYKPGVLSVEGGKVKFNFDFEGELKPLWTYKVNRDELQGCVVIKEMPNLEQLPGEYYVGYDPYRQDHSGSGQPSLASIYVMKSHLSKSFNRGTIVASYIGRLETVDSVNRVAELLCDMYNAKLMFENEVTHPKAYFEKRNKLHKLAYQPDAVISKSVKNGSSVNRIFGCHMNDNLKTMGEMYIKQWLLDVREFDENGVPITNLDTLDDPGLIEELIKYNRKGNFDRVMSFMMLMFQMEEISIGQAYQKPPERNQDVKDFFEALELGWNN